METGLDLTRGSAMRAILRFCIPVMIGNLFQALYQVVDSLIVGNVLGAGALAAVGASHSTTAFLLNFAVSMSTAYSVVISQNFGAKREDKVRATLASAIYITLALSVLLSLAGIFGARPLLRLLSTPADILDGAVLYTRICVGFAIGQIAYNGTAAVLRGVGDSRTPLYFLICASVLNIVLDLLFVAVFGWGVAGVAIATVISQLLSCVACMVYMVKKYPIFRIARADLLPDWHNLFITARMGLVISVQGIFTNAGEMVVSAVLNGYGTAAVAASAAVLRIQQFATLIFSSIANSYSVFVGQNLGARLFDRVKKTTRQVVVLVLALSAVSAALILLFGDHLIALFVRDTDASLADVLSYGQFYQRVTACFYPALALIWVYNGTLRGAGDTLVPLISGWAELLLKCGGTLAFSALWGYTGMCFGNPIGWAVGAVPSIVWYCTGRWKRHVDAITT